MDFFPKKKHCSSKMRSVFTVFAHKNSKSKTQICRIIASHCFLFTSKKSENRRRRRGGVQRTSISSDKKKPRTRHIDFPLCKVTKIRFFCHKNVCRPSVRQRTAALHTRRGSYAVCRQERLACIGWDDRFIGAMGLGGRPVCSGVRCGPAMLR